MASGRHRATRRRGPRRLLVAGAIVGALAAGDTASAVWSDDRSSAASTSASQSTLETQATPESPTTSTDGRLEYEERATRSRERPAPSPQVPLGGAGEAPPIDTEPRFLTEDLNVWTGPGEDTTLLMVLDEGSKIPVTGRVVDGWAEIVVDDRLRWVNAEYLAKERPEEEDDAVPAPDTGGLSDDPCPSGSEVESGLVANAIAVHRAVCAEFPEVTSYGGLRPGDDGEHGTGQALDIMIPDSATGDAIAAFVQDNYEALGVSEIIWSQQIWSVERASEGWRWMEDRGSDTANHYDHVHVTVY